MKRRLLIISIFFIVLILLSACRSEQVIPVQTTTETVPIPTSKAVPTTQPYPQTVDLTFKPVEMVPLKEGIPDSTWEPLKVIPFGAINQAKVELYTYHVPKRADDLFEVYQAYIKFQGKYYLINDEIFNDLSDIPQNDHSTLFLLQHTFSYLDNQFVMQGGIEIFSNGPGNVDYLMYDVEKKIWLSFSDWGKPQFVDLDSDGTDEFVIQFEGLHLQWPDVIVYEWNKGKLEHSNSLKMAIMSADSKQPYANLEANKTITFGDNREDGPTVNYSYLHRKLIKQ